MTDPVSTSGPIITSPIVQGGAAPPPVESPIVEGTSATTPIADPTGVVASPNPAAPAAGDPALDPSAADANKQVPDVIQRRINEITAQKYAAERSLKTEKDARIAAEKANTELLAKLAGGTPPAAAPAAPAPTSSVPANMSSEDFEKLVEERAVQKAEIDRFNKACDSVAAAGKKEFTDWDDAVTNLKMVGALGDNVPLEFLQTAIELKNPQKILHHLSKNLEEAGKLVKMPATKMAVEMARIEAQLNAAPPPPPPVPVSQAPAPVIPVGGATKAAGPLSLDDPNLTTEQFMALRHTQAEERRKRYQRA